MDNLEKYREKINEIDALLLELFAQRVELVKEIGKIKKEQGMPIHDEKREEEIKAALSEKAKEYGISKHFIETVWESIFQQSYNLEK